MRDETSLSQPEMSDTLKAVFLSYASQDAEAARRICDALRAAGVEVWFDQSELRGGDAWDQKIRKQIKECALFVPIISANTQARLEGYFRIEWKLAAQRTHAMADAKPFLVPVVLDATSDANAHVPEEFRSIQWTRLPGGETPAAFCERVRMLLCGSSEGEGFHTNDHSHAPPSGHKAPSTTKRGVPAFAWVAGAVLVLALALWQPWRKSEALSALPPKFATAASVSEARKLALQGKALIDDDPLLVRENYLAAERLCERAIAIDPAESEAWAILARAGAVLFADYQDWSGARREKTRGAAETALRLAPDSIESGLAMAYYDHRMGAGDAPAEARLRTLAERNPRDRRVLELLARIAFRDGRLADAEPWAARAQALPGGSPVAWVERARYYLGEDRLREMGEAVDRSLALRATTTGYYHKLIHLVWDWGELDAARAVLAGLPSSLFQEDNFAVFDYEVALWSRQFDRAATALQRVPRDFLEEFSIFYPKAFLIGEALHFSGKSAAAELQWRIALEAVEHRMRTEPDSARPLLWKSLLLARLGRRDEARQAFATATELNPSIVRKPGERFGDRLGLNGPQRWNHVIEPRFRVLMGDHEAAIDACERLLNRTIRRWSVGVNELRFNPVFDPLRTNPRFQALLRQAEGWLDESRQAASESSEPAKSAPGAVTDKSVASAKSIAVLPFANLSPDPENAFFADGVHEDVITNLAKIRDLKVISRTSTLAYRDEKQRNLRRIAEELGVASVLEGSVRRAGNKVRVAAKLIDARTDQPLWGDNYDGDLSDIFAVQATFAEKITTALRATLTPGEKSQIAQRPTQNQEAYDLFLRGRLMLESTATALPRRERFLAALSLLERAVVLDPNFVLAHALLVYVHGTMYWFPDMDPTAARAEKAKLAAETAVRLAPELPESRLAKGIFHFRIERDFQLAMTELRRAAAGLPNDPQVFFFLAWSQRRLGRWLEALPIFEKGAEVDPRQFSNAGYVVESLHWLRRYAAAEASAERFLTLSGKREDESVYSLAFARAKSAARFEQDGDVGAYLRRELARKWPTQDAQAILALSYSHAILGRDYPGAERLLAGKQGSLFSQPVLRSGTGFAEPIPLARASIAFLRGKSAAAQAHADEAVRFLQATPWTQRQAAWARIAAARAHALAGRVDQALREMDAGWREVAAVDQTEARYARDRRGEFYIVLGRREEALAELRDLMTGPSPRGPNEIRIDPFWSRLKDDPRFEEILKSAKPL